MEFGRLTCLKKFVSNKCITCSFNDLLFDAYSKLFADGTRNLDIANRLRVSCSD